MALLRVNGVPVECTASEWEPVTLGEVARSFNGWPRDTGRVKKMDFRFTSGLLSLPEAVAMRGLVEGAGHVLTFEDTAGYLYTSRELAPLSATGATRSTVGARHGSACLSVAPSSVVGWNVGTQGYEGEGGTFMGWVREGAGPWRHILYAAGGPSLHVDGQRANASGGYPFAQAQDGYLVLGDMGMQGVATHFDDVVALPYSVPSAWVPHLYAWHSARGWPALPYVVAQGPRFPAQGQLMLGKAGTGRTEALLTTVGESFDFSLHGT
ncbi:hypothetical protein D187_007495 [Cystobacter fuscus DSM 2262]|uniref:Uncharacterized protein n=1 Tax=Cystobacter fuscus (strain ATCC 25194 / DSM 2262 / NBRC 100088 / M29) TaxID=1242864 RepID=S9QI91_CYSF2|nr:hypothetical protein [Cystobacter fuscus]EPX56153.1 hypothetical protein D187_007495 [Cystobacter fuscus DSM 2262]